MSRALGDFHAHDHAGLTAQPDVRTWSLGEHDKYLLICSDGVWEFVSSQQAVELVGTGDGCAEAASRLADLSWAQWRKFDPSTVDDITAIVVDLQAAGFPPGGYSPDLLSAIPSREGAEMNGNTPEPLFPNPLSQKTGPHVKAPTQVDEAEPLNSGHAPPGDGIVPVPVVSDEVHDIEVVEQGA